MSVALPLALLPGIACILLRLAVSGLRTPVAFGEVLVGFVVTFSAWLMFPGLGVLGVEDAGGWFARAPGVGLADPWMLALPLLTTVGFLFFSALRAGRR